MSQAELTFINYLITDPEEGTWLGIREDAPDEIKKAYNNYLREKEKARKEGRKL